MKPCRQEKTFRYGAQAFLAASRKIQSLHQNSGILILPIITLGFAGAAKQTNQVACSCMVSDYVYGCYGMQPKTELTIG